MSGWKDELNGNVKIIAVLAKRKKKETNIYYLNDIFVIKWFTGG